MAVLGLFGVVPFVTSSEAILTPRNIQRKCGARYAEHAVIGKKPVLEYVGPSADELSFEIRLDSGLGSPPLAGIALLERMLESGSAFPFILGGEYFGMFVLSSMSEDRRFHTGAGVPRVAVVNIELKESGEGGIAGIIQAASNGGLNGVVNGVKSGVTNGIDRVRGFFA